MLAKFGKFEKISKISTSEIRKRCKGVHCVDLGESGGELRDVEEEFSEYVRHCYGYLSKFHFSVSHHVPFLNLLFEQIANSNKYLLVKFGFDTAENEP